MAVDPAKTSTPPGTRREVDVQRELGDRIERTKDYVAEECPVQLLYQGVPHVVMLASPADLEDLGVGFTLTEGIVAHPKEIRAVEVVNKPDALAVHLQIASERFAGLLRRQRNLTARTGCGLCGVETLEEAIRPAARVGSDVRVSREEVRTQLAQLHTKQALNAITGSVHAAAWGVPGQGLQVVREDVGRHNALDKVIGALVRANIDCSSGYLIVTSRASYEIVQKAAVMGVSFIAAVSAPTALAIDVAERSGVTLIGFARPERHVIYSHPERLHA